MKSDEEISWETANKLVVFRINDRSENVDREHAQNIILAAIKESKSQHGLPKSHPNEYHARCSNSLLAAEREKLEKLRTAHATLAFELSTAMIALAAEREEMKQWQQRFEQAAADSYAYGQQLLAVHASDHTDECIGRLCSHVKPAHASEQGEDSPWREWN